MREEKKSIRFVTDRQTDGQTDTGPYTALAFNVAQLNTLRVNTRKSTLYPRDAMLARLLAMAPCPSVTSRSFIETVERIELVSGMDASFGLSCTAF